MTDCERIQARLAAASSFDPWPLDLTDQAHFNGCERCQGVLIELRSLDDNLRQLPTHAPTPELVRRVQMAAASEGASGTAAPKPRYERQWAGGLAALAASVAVIVLLPDVYSGYWDRAQQPLAEQISAPIVSVDQVAVRTEPVAAQAQRPGRALGSSESDRKRARLEISVVELASRTDAAQSFADTAEYEESSVGAGDLAPAGPAPSPLGRASAGLDLDKLTSGKRKAKERADSLPGKSDQPVAVASPSLEAPSHTRGNGDADASNNQAHRDDDYASLPSYQELGSGQRSGGFERRELQAFRWGQDGETQSFSAGQGSMDESKRSAPSPLDLNTAGVEPGSSAKQLLAEWEAVSGLRFQPAQGYFSNTYVPGDPAQRLAHLQLQTQLAQWDRTALRPAGAERLQLEQQIHPLAQPFDAPIDSALALYLHADQTGIHGSERLRLQVGIKGAERHSGLRPAMNIGIVLDLRASASVAQSAMIRAALLALLAAKQPGDRFSLSVAGAGGGQILDVDHFRHGPIKLALNQLLDSVQNPGAGVSLTQALDHAYRSIAMVSTPEAPLGTSLVLLLTGSSVELPDPALEQAVHNNAVNGINLSVATLGASANGGVWRRLVLAGQGNLQRWASAAAVPALVEQELFASGRAVARALRLRIRLAPGVRLVSILGAKRLVERQAQRVREQERGIDRRLAQELGVSADRGEDEDGIQIVIPHFYAADEHVVLLDVVAANPGPIADVTVRYKDLLHLRNGSAAAQLTLDDGVTPLGPLELNVMKNHLAFIFADAARGAGQLLAQGNAAAARARLTPLAAVWRELRATVPAWRQDTELRADERLLSEYVSVLRSPLAVADAHRLQLAMSLRLAGDRKLFSIKNTNSGVAQ